MNGAGLKLFAGLAMGNSLVESGGNLVEALVRVTAVCDARPLDRSGTKRASRAAVGAHSVGAARDGRDDAM